MKKLVIAIFAVSALMMTSCEKQDYGTPCTTCGGNGGNRGGNQQPPNHVPVVCVKTIDVLCIYKITSCPGVMSAIPMFGQDGCLYSGHCQDFGLFSFRFAKLELQRWKLSTLCVCHSQSGRDKRGWDFGEQ
jgi:hypothetical protein